MTQFESLAPEKRHEKSVDSMKKDNRVDKLRQEYDFATMPGGVRGKYAERYRRGTNLVRLDPDVAKAFPSEESVNEALRAVMLAAESIQSEKGSG